MQQQITSKGEPAAKTVHVHMVIMHKVPQTALTLLYFHHTLSGKESTE